MILVVAPGSNHVRVGDSVRCDARLSHLQQQSFSFKGFVYSRVGIDDTGVNGCVGTQILVSVRLLVEVPQFTEELLGLFGVADFGQTRNDRTGRFGTHITLGI